jgi:hypothetical protein
VSEGGQIDLRLYIEGVRVPISGITVSEGIGSTSQASLRLPYHSLGRRLHERDLVHVFYRDTSRIGFSRSPIQEGDHPDYTGSFLGGGFSREDRRADYLQLFWGEIAGRARAISVSRNELSLTCLGFSNYLDAVRLCQALRGRGTFSDTERHLVGIDNLASGTTMTASGIDAYDREQIPREVHRTGRYATAETLIQYMRENGGDIQKGLRNLVTELIDKTNSFYRGRSRLLRLGDVIRAVENDQTSQAIMDLGVFRRFLRERLSAVGYLFTIRDVIRVFSELIFHDFVEHSSPTYFPILSSASSEVLDSSLENRDQPAINRGNQADKVTSWVFKPELWWTAPPACNILFPNQYSQVSESDQILSEPTRTLLKIQPGASNSRRTIADTYFAPDLASLNTLALSVPEADQDRFVLPHERFRGIIPNVVLINEIGRLVDREESQAYLKSYSQFLHWRSSYGNRGIQIGCPHLMTQVLVGYPALLLDPHTVNAGRANDDNRSERMRLGRELALLRRVLRLLQALLGRLRGDLNQINQHAHYFSWLISTRDVIETHGKEEGEEVRYNLERANMASLEWSYHQPRPELSIAEHVSFQRSISPTAMPDFSSHLAGGRVASREESVGLSASSLYYAVTESSRPEGTRASRRSFPRANAAFLERYFGDRARPVIPDPAYRITGSPRENFSLINGLTAELVQIAGGIRSRIAALEALIGEVQAAIEAILALLRGELALSGQLEHLLFYVMGKTINIDLTEETGSVFTTIQGAFTRTYDEDIDLDGSKGDSFEGIIQTGTGGFLSEIYSPGRIGPDFYRPLYGVKSLLEVGEEAQERLSALEDRERQELEEVPEGETWQELIDRAYAFLRESPEDTPGEGSSVVLAVEALVDLYQSLHRVGIYNTNLFTEAVTGRSIVTEMEILGASLILPSSGGPPLAQESGNFQGARAQGLVPRVGFHQFSVLQPDGTFDTSGLREGESGESQEVAETRHRLVRQYLQALSGVRL